MQSFRKLIQKTLLKQAMVPRTMTQAAMRFTHHTPECAGVFPKYHVQARVQHPAPNFEGMAWDKDKFRKISLSDYKGKWVVLFTYPLDFTFVCPTEIVEFNDKAEDFKTIGCEVIAASIDSHFTHMEFANKPREQGGLGGMKIPMFADLTKQLGKDYGCLTNDDALHLRATFIIDDKGVLRHQQFNDLPVGRNVNEIFRLVQGFQYADKHGEVCPSKWTPGKEGIVADVKSQKTLKYWKEEHAHK